MSSPNAMYQQQLQQQAITDTAVGQGIYAMYGGTPPAPQSGGLGSIGSAPNVPVAAPAQLGQGGTGQSPMSSTLPVASVTAPSPLPGGQPRNPIAGQAPPGLAGATPQQQPQQQTSQPSPQLQAQQQQPRQMPDLSMHEGQFDFPSLAKALVAKGMPPQQIGRIIGSPMFEKMLNAQGLQQYRALNFGERQYEFDERDRRASEREAGLDERQARGEAYRTNITASQIQMGAIKLNADKQIATINAAVVANKIEPADAQKQIKAILDDLNTKVGEQITKMLAGPGEGGSSAPTGAGTEQDPVVVKTPKDAQALKPGTIYKTPDGQVMVR
jgi:hypothetical protein